jgi:hypothetical protein
MPLCRPAGVALLVVLMALAVATPASAHEFHAESAPAVLEGISTTAVYFENPASELDVECPKEKSFLRGEVSKTTQGSVTLHPEYQNCIVPKTAITGTVWVNGCAFVLQGATSEGHGPVSIECESGKTMELRIENSGGPLCTAKFGSQTPAGGAVYENQGSGSGRDFNAKLTMTGITYTTVNYNPLLGCSAFFGNGKDLSITGTYTVRGFHEFGGSQLGVWVE